MTEKRFKLKDYGYDGWAVEDITGEIFENDYIEDMSSEQVVDLLNAFYDENEQLKSKIKLMGDAFLKFEEIFYVDVCEKSEHYDEKVLNEISNSILGDLE